MKIGYDYTQPSLSPGGCGWYAYSLLSEMAKLAPQDQFLAYRHFGATVIPEERLAPLPQAANISDALAGAQAKAAESTWRHALQLQSAPGKPELVHSLSFQSPRFTDSKLILTIFDLAFWVHPEYSTKATRLFCENGILDALEHADGLIFISEHARAEFDRWLSDYPRRGQIPSIVTPLAGRYEPISQKQTAVQASRGGDYWLFVGSLEPRKNLAGLLDAYEAYAQGHPAPKPLHIAGGSGWKNEEIRAKLALLEARGLARHLGVVPDAQLPQLYQNAAGFIFPSWYEGFGLPVLEAMSQGCPVICSDRSSLPEVAGEAALYIAPAAPSTIATAMRRIEAEPVLRTDLINAGLAQAAKFSWERTAQQTLDFYRQVLAAPLTRDSSPIIPQRPRKTREGGQDQSGQLPPAFRSLNELPPRVRSNGWYGDLFTGPVATFMLPKQSHTQPVAPTVYYQIDSLHCPRTVEVYADQEHVGTLDIAAGTPCYGSLLLPTDTRQLILHTADASQLSTDDTRLLGIHLRSLEVHFPSTRQKLRMQPMS